MKDKFAIVMGSFAIVVSLITTGVSLRQGGWSVGFTEGANYGRSLERMENETRERQRIETEKRR
jgi:hypothetical protein